MSRIEDYALVGDTQTAALVGTDGSLDWLCAPRFDSPACFAALLGDDDNGCWRISPRGSVQTVRRRYLGDTLVLQTDLETATGTARLVDFMPVRARTPRVVRIVYGIRGRVDMRMDLRPRFDYGRRRPRLRVTRSGCVAIAGPDSVWLQSDVATRLEDHAGRSDFAVSHGGRVAFVLSWLPSHEPAPGAIDAAEALRETEAFWSRWISACSYRGEWRQAVVRSLLTLKALTYAPTGGIVAAPTTSLPEQPGGVRNWDYRFCWLRDASVTLLALTRTGFTDEAAAWHAWLLRTAAGDPADLQTIYGIAGERRLDEVELPWLSGYEGSRPVRIGNGAAEQFQLDIFGEVVNTLHEARRAGIEDGGGEVWELTFALVEYIESHWRLPDEGVWEVRGPRRHFVSSKVEAWVAVDRAIKDAEELGLRAPLVRWRKLREQIRAEVLLKGYDPKRATFTQAYDSAELDASALMFSLIGFLPARDERMLATVAAIERHLCHDGLVYRYTTRGDGVVDGLPEGEGAFLACSFWLAANYALAGRHQDARELFSRLLGLRNDLGLLAEQYDPRTGRQLGNFPQAFSHVPLILSAQTLDRATPTRDQTQLEASQPPAPGRNRDLDRLEI
jgi:GH15 family glucan-1,4-alpha-glucosidase